MIVSLNWLADYLPLPTSLEELTERLTLSGLNLEGIDSIGDDVAIDLEVTSNRPDCLGHVGVAREIAVLFGGELTIPAAQPRESGPPATQLTSVTIDSPQLCPRYIARIIQGVTIGPSPPWLADRLRTLGISVINNVVDVSNYVMMECGQPLHAFDFATLAGRRIIVREARPGELFTAIDHREYELASGICVIADTEKVVALAGVMGGAESEVSESTTDLLIESADFDPLSIRTTSRRLNLKSPSSYRFERGVDPAGVDWASRRCCELILETAGGRLAAGSADAGPLPPKRAPIKLRLGQLERILGITIPTAIVRSILTALGNRETHACSECIKTIPPSWRNDLTREVDLIEEVGRVYGYDKIPADVGVALCESSKSRQDQVIEKTQMVMLAAGFDEAMTISAVDKDQRDIFCPWTAAQPLQTSIPVLRRADRLRQSIVPSLLASRLANQSLSNTRIELFETAKVYLPRAGQLPDERWMLALTSSARFTVVKGIIEAVVQAVAPAAALGVALSDDPLFEPGRGAELRLCGERFGYLGEVSDSRLALLGLRDKTTVAEIDLGVLVAASELIRQVRPLSSFPPVDRDLNVVFAEGVGWTDVERIVRAETTDVLEQLLFQEEYRDQKRLGPGRKSLLFRMRLRSHEGTLTSEAADAIRDRVVAQLASQLGGSLRA